jgi:hypothetical protein
MSGNGGGHRDGRRRVVAVASLSVLAVVVGCEDAREARGTAAMQPSVTPGGQTEQVVHRITPSPAQPAGASAPAPNASTSVTRMSSTGNSPPAVDGITSKHLEAELNRLEAELGN